MRNMLPKFLQWRYDLYLSEKFDLYGTLGFYIKQQVRRFKLIGNSKVAYIYANKRNVGDYISSCGIQQVVGLEGPELFSSPEWSKSLNNYLKKIKNRNPNCLLIIGGGGLLQPVFTPFWDTILNSGIRFVALGIGVNHMQGREVIDPIFIDKIIDKAEFFGVRDTSTLKMISPLYRKKVQLEICPSVNFVKPLFWQPSPEKNNTLLHIKHPSDLRLSGIDEELLSNNLKKIAKQNGWLYEENTNMSSDHIAILTKVSLARFVVSSRLHGCIMSFACGIPFLPILCDKKIAAFNDTHTGVKGISPVDVTDTNLLIKRITYILGSFDNQEDKLNNKVQNNIELGLKINDLTGDKPVKTEN